MVCGFASTDVQACPVQLWLTSSSQPTILALSSSSSSRHYSQVSRCSAYQHKSSGQPWEPAQLLRVSRLRFGCRIACIWPKVVLFQSLPWEDLSNAKGCLLFVLFQSTDKLLSNPKMWRRKSPPHCPGPGLFWDFDAILYKTKLEIFLRKKKRQNKPNPSKTKNVVTSLLDK